MSDPVTPPKTDPGPPVPLGPDDGTKDATPGSGSNLKTIGLITSGAVALVGAGVGVGFLMAANSASDDVDALKADSTKQVGTNGCNNQPSATVCVDLADANKRAKRNTTISTIGFVGAGVGVAGLVTFLLLPNQKKESATSVYPLLDQHTMGLGASGRF